jgi:hypothetical protein
MAPNIPAQSDRAKDGFARIGGTVQYAGHFADARASKLRHTPGDKKMTRIATLALLALAITGCAGKTAYRDSCASQLDSAWRELDLAKAEGFAGTVSYSKALTLLTGAKTSQQFEGYESCTRNAEKARFYIRESRAGR